MRQILRLMTLLLLLTISFVAKADWSEPFLYEGVWYQSDSNRGQARVVAAPEGQEYSGAVKIANTAINPATPNRPFVVRIINKYAFRDSKITSVTLPEPLAEIDSSAFASCRNLTFLKFPDSGQLQKIAYHAFYASGLETVIISANQPYFNAPDIFDRCTELKNFYISEQNKAFSVRDGVLYNKDGSKLYFYPKGKNKVGTFTVPDHCIEISPYAFEHAENIDYLVVPDNVKTLGEGSFWGCKFSKCTIGNGVTSIPKMCFFAAGKINSVILLGNNVEYIGVSAFDICDAKTISIHSNVKCIDFMAFYDTKSLEEIQLPLSLDSIGNSAFRGSAISEVTINPNVRLGVGVFSGNENLQKITIADGVKKLPLATFAGCLGIRQISIPASVEYIGQQVLNNCQSLETISVDSNNPYFLSRDNVLYSKDMTRLIAYAPANERSSYEIPSGVKEIGDGAFTSSINLKEVKLPSTIEKVGLQSFWQCISLESITIPDKVKALGQMSFCECVSLTEANLPKGLETIGSQAFQGCEILSKFNFPSSLRTIGSYAFNGALDGYNLQLPEGLDSIGNNAFEFAGIGNTPEIVIPASVTKWGQYSFFKGGSHKKVTILANCPVPDCAFQLNSGIEEVYIAGSVKKIGRNIFDTYEGLCRIQKITLEEGITEIGQTAFPGLYTDFKLPNSVVKVGDNVCLSPNLKNLELGSGLEEIGTLGERVTNLSILVSRAEIPPTFTSRDDKFVPEEVYNKATLYVPEKSIDAYKAAPHWSRFLNIKSIEKDLAGVDTPMADNLTVTVNGNEINVTGYDGNISVTNLSGRTVYNGPATTVAVSESGLYIVRAADKTWKLMVK